MFHKALMIQGLRKQNARISDLLRHFENKENLIGRHGAEIANQSTEIANSLRELRKIKQDYLAHIDLASLWLN